MKEEYRVLEYNLTTTEVELVNVSASWDEVRFFFFFLYVCQTPMKVLQCNCENNFQMITLNTKYACCSQVRLWRTSSNRRERSYFKLSLHQDTWGFVY